MESKLILGEPWNIYGKQIVPVLRTLRLGRRRTAAGKVEYALAWLRPAGFLVREDGRDVKIRIPWITSAVPLMMIWGAGVFLLLRIVRTIYSRRNQYSNVEGGS